MRIGTISLPYLEEKYDLLSIDTATRYRHPGLLGAESIVWDEGASYRIFYPTFTYPFPTSGEVSWKELYSGLRWLHSKGRALRHITKEMLFASVLPSDSTQLSDNESNDTNSREKSFIQAQIYVGEHIVIATPENCRHNFDMLNSYVPACYQERYECQPTVNEEEGNEYNNYDIFFDESDLDYYPGRDILKSFVELLFQQYSSWAVGDIFRVIDIYQRLLMFSEESPHTLQKVAIECVERTFHGKKHDVVARRHVLERHLLLNYHGVFYSPLEGQLQKKSDVHRLVMYHILNFDPTTYFLATRVAGKGNNDVIYMTLSDALSTR